LVAIVLRRTLTTVPLILALLLALAAGSPASAEARKAPPGLFGLGDWAFPRDKEVRVLRRHGLRWWRTTLNWGAVEARRGQYNFSGYDQLLRRMQRRNVRTLLVIAGCPDWACSQAGPPRTPQARDAWHRFVNAAVQRYGRRGILRKRPVTHWQVMNEVNGADQWPNPSPAGYAALLRTTNQVIKRADPRAKVVLAGLSEKMTIWLRDYLPALYRQRGFAGSFDIMGVHGYAVTARGTARVLNTTRRIMRHARDARKPIWITEISWATGGPPFPFRVSAKTQARRLRQSFGMLTACRKRWRLQKVMWFAYQDRSTYGEQDYWGFHNGLTRKSGSRKPAYRQFVRYLGKSKRASIPRRCTKVRR
jgi:GH35 family endo-1,4-beta-xylanase